MNTSLRLKLSIMMFLEFFVWGSWFVTIGSYLGNIGFSGANIGSAYLMNNIAAIIAPFFIGMIADRFFSSEKVMGVLHLVGAGIMYYTTMVSDTYTIIALLLLYNACYMPTLALVNNISFQQMQNPDKEFPKIRVWGTIGWIVAGLAISFALAPVFSGVELTSIPLKMAAISSVFLGIYSFFLPGTPPKNVGAEITVGDILGLKAIRLMKESSFAIFVASSLLISIPLAFYYSFTNLWLNEIGMSNAAATQSMGQMSEVLFMLLMPWFFVRLGVKKMLLVGMLSWVVRYALFAMGDVGGMVWMIYLGIVIHGVCYDFFFVTGQIYVDRKAPRDIRASAQGLITLITYGLGMGIGNVISGNVLDLFTTDGIKNWESFWWVPCLFALVVSVIFQLAFKEDKTESENT